MRKLIMAVTIALAIGTAFAQSWQYGTIVVGRTIAEWNDPTETVQAVGLHFLAQKLLGQPYDATNIDTGRDMQKLLTYLGEKGWEVTGISLLPDGSTLVILKRPLG